MGDKRVLPKAHGVHIYLVKLQLAEIGQELFIDDVRLMYDACGLQSGGAVSHILFHQRFKGHGYVVLAAVEKSSFPLHGLAAGSKADLLFLLDLACPSLISKLGCPCDLAVLFNFEYCQRIPPFFENIGYILGGIQLERDRGVVLVLMG